MPPSESDAVLESTLEPVSGPPSDMELLELDLDGALEPAEHQALSRRLAAEPTLIGLRAELEAQRRQRQAMFRALEPSDAEVERFGWRLAGATAEHRAAERHHQSNQHSGRRLDARPLDPWRLTRWGTAAAACLLFGFLAGRSSHSVTLTAASPGSAPGSAVATQTLEPSQAFAPGSSAVASNTLTPMVPVSNEYGQVVAWQPFHNTEDARHFAEDLNRARLPVQAQLGDNVKLAADEKF